jgi:hypothetical protein
MSTRRVATISFGIAVVSAGGMALAVQRRPRCSTTNTSLVSSSWSPTAKRPAGTHLAAETEEDLVEALDKTLGYPMVTQRLEVVWLASWAASHH